VETSSTLPINEAGDWLGEFLGNLTLIAKKSPPLTAGSANNYFDPELDSIHIFRLLSQNPQSNSFKIYEVKFRQSLEMLPFQELKAFFSFLFFSFLLFFYNFFDIIYFFKTNQKSL